jgi:hypothetical protein
MNSLKQILLAKLRRPVHVSYISNNLTKLPLDMTMDIINEMIQDELLEESEYGKGYYIVKKLG